MRFRAERLDGKSRKAVEDARKSREKSIKTKEEIQTAYEKGKELSYEERLKRLQASGLPTMITNKRK